MKKYKIAAILMIIHGGFMELGGIFAMISALLIGTDKYDIGQYFEFKLPYFQDNLYMMMVMGAIYGVFRLIGAIGLLKNRMSIICNKLCYYNYIDDVFVACWNYGWNTCRKCFDINPDAVFW